MPRVVHSEETWAEAEHLLTPESEGGGGLTYAQVAEQTGITRVSLYRKFPQFKRNPDPVPGGKKPKGGKGGKKGGRSPFTSSVTDEQLVPFYSKVASAPAVPMMLYVQCDFCAQHFAEQGPDVAEKLVALSNSNPHLRQVMEIGYKSLTQAAWASVLLMYVGVPVAHHMAPQNVQAVLKMFGILPMDGIHVHPPTREQASTNGNGAEPQPESNPFDGYDLSELLAMAPNYGIKVEDFSAPTDEVVDVDEVINPVTDYDAETDPESPDNTADYATEYTDPSALEADESDTVISE